ncbi:MAG: PQQ-binding-like beta-propeller repeat protein [Candidatus Bathyarchaeia archaeon]
MGNARNRTKANLIALFLISAMVFVLVAIPTANAHDPAWTIISYAYVVPAPNPVGLGQRVAIVMWVDTPLPGALVTNDIRRHDYKLTITKPDGSKEVYEWDIVWDTTSFQYFTYTPNQVGEYKLLFEYPGQTYTWTGDYKGDFFTPATATATFTVQEDPLPEPTTSYPLPTEYWTRPIEGQNSYWYTIASNWLGPPYIRTGESSTGGAGYARFQPDGTAPNSPHIMWTRPIQDGGVVGGSNVGREGNTFYMGGSYNTRFSNALVMYGRLFYELPYGNSGGGGGWICVDLRTGEEIWYNAQIGASGTGLDDPAFGYYYCYDDGNQHGILPIGLLFTSNFKNAYDPATGKPTSTNITGVPSGTQVVGPKGEIIRYVLKNVGTASNPQYRLLQWNSSYITFETAGQIGAANWYPGTIDASQDRFYDWNISLSGLGPGTWSAWREASLDNIMLLTQGSFGTHVGVYGGGTISDQGANVTAISLKPESRGQILWTKHYPVAPNNVSREITAWDPELGVFVMEDKETMAHYGYSLADGSLLWTNTDPVNPYDTLRSVSLAAYGKLYLAGFGGILYCYDMANGTLLWTYGNGGEGNSTFSGLETPWGHYPIFVDVIADGKVYVGTTEHSPDSPYYKGAKYRCINATTGEEIWTMLGWGSGMYVGSCDVVADGFFVYLNCYDMQIYCIGKGPSATTVTASPKVTVHGSKILVEGTVTDIAAGTKQKEQAARFPNGVPAVSDESMSTWMEYVYMQKPKPTDVKGVEVIIEVHDPNNNYYEVARTTSDSNGFYKTTFKPPVPGEYTIIARFAGSESYYGSSAETAVYVEEAPVATTEATPAPQAPVETYFAVSTIAIIAAIAIVGILILRKR